MLKTHINTLDRKNNNENLDLFTCKLRTTTKTTVVNKASMVYCDIWYTDV